MCSVVTHIFRLNGRHANLVILFNLQKLIAEKNTKTSGCAEREWEHYNHKCGQVKRIRAFTLQICVETVSWQCYGNVMAMSLVLREPSQDRETYQIKFIISPRCVYLYELERLVMDLVDFPQAAGPLLENYVICYFICIGVSLGPVFKFYSSTMQ